MTTKKQRRENTAKKTATRLEAERQVNLDLLRKAQAKREQKAFDAERVGRKTKARSEVTDKQIQELASSKEMTVSEFLATTHAFENAVLRAGRREG